MGRTPSSRPRMCLQFLMHPLNSVLALAQPRRIIVLGSSSLLPRHPQLGGAGQPLETSYDSDLLLTPIDEETVALRHPSSALRHPPFATRHSPIRTLQSSRWPADRWAAGMTMSRPSGSRPTSPQSALRNPHSAMTIDFALQRRHRHRQARRPAGLCGRLRRAPLPL